MNQLNKSKRNCEVLVQKETKASPDWGKGARVQGSGQDDSPQNKNNAATRQNVQDTVTTF